MVPGLESLPCSQEDLTMANHRWGPRRAHSEWWYYEQLPEKVRRALWDGPVPWGACQLLSYFKKVQKVHGTGYATKLTIEQIENWHTIDIARGEPWQPKKGKKIKSPHVQAKATMQ